MNSSDLYLSKKHGRTLSPGKMSESQFWLLAEISPVHSEKVLNALRDFLVLGYTRREPVNDMRFLRDISLVLSGVFSVPIRR